MDRLCMVFFFFIHDKLLFKRKKRPLWDLYSSFSLSVGHHYHELNILSPLTYSLVPSLIQGYKQKINKFLDNNLYSIQLMWSWFLQLACHPCPQLQEWQRCWLTGLDSGSEQFKIRLNRDILHINNQDPFQWNKL